MVATCSVKYEDVFGAAPTSDFIWVINNLIAYEDVAYIKGFTVFIHT